jgi:cytochrome c-type protein NapC
MQNYRKEKVKLVVIRGKKNPVNWWKLVFVLIFICIVFISAGVGVNSYTNSPSFCASCHELAPEYMTYRESSHNQISCVQCHEKPGLINIIQGKKDLLHDVYTHFKNKPKQILETNKLAVSNENCLQCHSKNRLVTASGDLKVNHKGHIEKGIPCITCHAGVAHSKIAERTINIQQNLKYWTKVNTVKLIKDQYVKPNMGTCIDCHNKVNNGQEPWKEIAYIVPKISNQTEDQNHLSLEVTAKAEGTDNVQIAKDQQDKITQGIILQAIGKKTKNVKIPMKCETCHRKIKVPESHNNFQWDVNHGNTAMQVLNKCLNCHQDSKWVKEMPEEDIKTQLTLSTQEEKYSPNYQMVKDESRKNKFCKTCHSEEPPSHAGEWALGHAVSSLEDNEKLKCYICHDREKPKSDPSTIKAPSDVYCEYCHKNGFSGILNGAIGD